VHLYQCGLSLKFADLQPQVGVFFSPFKLRQLTELDFGVRVCYYLAINLTPNELDKEER